MAEDSKENDVWEKPDLDYNDSISFKKSKSKAKKIKELENILNERKEVDPKTKLKFAKQILFLVALFYLITSLTYSYYTEAAAAEVWKHFSQVGTNLIMLVVGCYFAKEE